jgi:hypothetical protein
VDLNKISQGLWSIYNAKMANSNRTYWRQRNYFVSRSFIIILNIFLYIVNKTFIILNLSDKFSILQCFTFRGRVWLHKLIHYSIWNEEKNSLQVLSEKSGIFPWESLLVMDHSKSFLFVLIKKTWIAGKTGNVCQSQDECQEMLCLSCKKHQGRRTWRHPLTSPKER